MAEPEPEPVDPLLQASLLASNLQNAFATGRPFQTELTGLQAALPDLAVPQEVATRAAEGLPTPSDLVARLEELAPGMLAARPPRPDASLQEGAADWLASVLAIRPTGEADGNDPAAILSRLEGALEREDYAMAEGLIAQLPAPMIEAAQELPADITTRARANDFTQALAARVQTSGEPA